MFVLLRNLNSTGESIIAPNSQSQPLYVAMATMTLQSQPSTAESTIAQQSQPNSAESTISPQSQCITAESTITPQSQL